MYHASGASNGYDPLNRLTDFRRGTLSDANSDGILDTVTSANRTQSWTLDQLGNWSSLSTNGTPVSRTHNGQNQVTAVGANNLTFDNNGNTTKDDTGKQYVYDAWNRIMTVKNSGGTVIEYMKYMANAGRGTAGTSGCPSTTTQTYYSMDWQILQKVDTTTPAPPCQSGVTTSTYVWSLSYIDDLVAKDCDTPSGRTYVQQDANHNVTALVNTSGTVTQRQIYDPYGVATVLTSAWGSSGNAMFEYGHQGGRYDSISGLYNFRWRDYSPTLGRWMQQDPILYIDGANLYQFERSMAPGSLDPSGLIRVDSGNVDIVHAFRYMSSTEIGSTLVKEIEEIERCARVVVRIEQTPSLSEGSNGNGDKVQLRPADQVGFRWMTLADGTRKRDRIFTVRTGDGPEDVEIGDPLDSILYHELTHVLHDQLRAHPELRGNKYVPPARGGPDGEEELFTTALESTYRQETGRKPRTGYKTTRAQDEYADKVLAQRVFTGNSSMQDSTTVLDKKREAANRGKASWFADPGRWQVPD